jgi:hypothetical protein
MAPAGAVMSRSDPGTCCSETVTAFSARTGIRRRPILDGLLNEYEAAA